MWISTQIILIYKISNCSLPLTVHHEIIICNVKNFLQALPALLLAGLLGHDIVRGAFLACKRSVTTSVCYRNVCLPVRYLKTQSLTLNLLAPTTVGARINP